MLRAVNVLNYLCRHIRGGYLAMFYEGSMNWQDWEWHENVISIIGTWLFGALGFMVFLLFGAWWVDLMLWIINRWEPLL